MYKYLALLERIEGGRKIQGIEFALLHIFFLGAALWTIGLGALCITATMMMIHGPSAVPDTGSPITSFLRTSWGDPTMMFWFNIAKRAGIWGSILIIGSLVGLRINQSRKEGCRTTSQ